ncbi:MAG: DUF3467 domain-containing protein [Candidatus Zixiibacteriota bacterium]|nr:MAG: DUF3467 domain-containing protein [candidate division Zixibacteria bacterium]HDL03255.1 DUF3467 domain-containing protein [candidate division Zixibacteria bacterium]
MKQQRINIELGEKEAEGTYANMAMIAHSPTEIILDFVRIMPGAPKAKVQSRVIMTPAHAKMLHKTLGENIAKFEKQFGEIKIHSGVNALHGKNIGFESSMTSGEETDD